ncbi:MAG: hypothetical protein E4H31_02570 [Dehalococcoidia bacterium]|nr:MAG: hypothetical protein E4H31_02570 [Dehalococcoidia bacterium]
MSTALTHQDAMNWLVKFAIIPYWDSIDNKALFRKASVKKDSVPFISREAEEQAWPGAVKLLAIKTEADCATVRRNVEHLLREQGKLL